MIFGQVENGLGQLNPSLIYHWQKPLQAIITVSFNAHEEDIKTKLNGLPTCSLALILTAFRIFLFVDAVIRSAPFVDLKKNLHVTEQDNVGSPDCCYYLY